MTETNDFGWALAQMRQGQRVRRRSWSTGEWIQITVERKRETMRDEDGAETRFTSQEVILSKDWEIAP